MDTPAPLPAVQVLGGFALTINDRPVALGQGARRLIAFLALQRGPCRRAFVAGTLWPDTTDRKAAANLRTALWRANSAGVAVVVATPSTVQLDPTVEIDRCRLERLAAVPYEAATGERLDSRSVVELSGLCEELLPEFDEAWVIAERERCRQLALHTLEAAARRATAEGRHSDGVMLALAAIRWDPLRESATRALVEAHLAQGNLADAERAYAQYATSLAAELGAEPHPDFALAMRRGGRGGAA
ncbi:MAG TPA: BTAD domain-containing putative transcriptional regulator [Microthrixaceae bacterium]|nr:BTAD domain-containing putative transcriptional regulator [Microthrixaceae bacterium]HMT25055.1 BTAD domain-containing putative transcriptional regulator [Microthrixaceae bacterium]HMT61157.1 BTAD domain-containing putative transcriptional regulator [Microthrixaceae bacterium]